ncbi:sigma 54-interacting transcriptional regulator [Undibacterium sp. TS12]|uniref:sigma 54-interacting transcriptional regulator n=1 Tax=Undibacterium sp. TS12 TaxID=2908202 RepID=UPI001F4D1DAA|nr:sigma 54-interacting transcriptional regulator [Undibacterium sp. TS12]MCH8622389.1 sigma 54-interacting transcriptional regulator [Undibacterium sp. TS12]
MSNARLLPHVLLVDDDTDMLTLISMRLRAAGYRVTAVDNAEAALAMLAVDLPSLVISDIRLPGMDGRALFDEIRRQYNALPVILLTAHGTIPDAVDATSHGVYAYLTKPFDGTVLLEKIKEALQLGGISSQLQNSDTSWRSELISRSQSMAELLAEAKLVAGTDASVLIQGESGTGKELLARAIHRASARARAPFVAINCGAIPEQLLESELFGHVKGAFSGAVSSRAGLFHSAHGGTLFLDEIGDMPLSLQVKLLRVLQERQVKSVGADHSSAVDVRILSATHRDLELALREGQFREDLYYRLNVVRLALPALADRREDISLLANYFRQQLAEKYRKKINGFSPDALASLMSAPWPGNVRQLHNVVEQVCALATTPIIPLSLVERALCAPTLELLSYQEARTRFERNYLIQLLKFTDGNVSDAARIAGRNRTEFYRMLQKHQLTPNLFRDDADVVATKRQ